MSPDSKCPRCGRAIVVGAKFCGGCGAVVEVGAVTAPAKSAPSGRRRKSAGVAVSLLLAAAGIASVVFLAGRDTDDTLPLGIELAPLYSSPDLPSLYGAQLTPECTFEEGSGIGPAGTWEVEPGEDALNFLCEDEDKFISGRVETSPNMPGIEGLFSPMCSEGTEATNHRSWCQGFTEAAGVGIGFEADGPTVERARSRLRALVEAVEGT